MMKSIIGIGLVALDVVVEKNSDIEPVLYAGGSCGNVLSILSYLGMVAFPIARLANNKATDKVISDIESWGVRTDLILRGDDGSTPVIIQRLTVNKEGKPVHRFEFRNPETGKYLPSFKPVLAKSIAELIQKKSQCDFFYIDRLSRSSIELAKLYKEAGAIVFFEPSSLKPDKIHLFNELIEFIDIIKFSVDRIPDYKVVYASGIIPLEIETLGGNGVNYRFNIEKQVKWNHISSYHVENIIDTAGAGDWTSAGIIKFLTNLNVDSISALSKSSIESMILYGQALGAISCFYKGARGMMYNVDNIILEEMVENLIEENFITGIKQSNKVDDSDMTYVNSISSLIA